MGVAGFRRSRPGGLRDGSDQALPRGWGPGLGGGRVVLEWLRSRGMESGQFGLLEKSASWAQVGGDGGGWEPSGCSMMNQSRRLREHWGKGAAQDEWPL